LHFFSFAFSKLGGDNLVRIENLEKSFQGRVILRQINLEVQAGEIMVIMGPSGCGKSTILRHLNGLLLSDGGQIYIDGRKINNLAEEEWDTLRRDIGMVFQNAALFDSLTIGENVAFPLKYHSKLSPAEQMAIVQEKLNLVGLAGKENLLPAQLSGGMQKRVSLARAIAFNPRIILYDEPTSGLDPVMSHIIDQLILKMRNQLGVTSLVVTHDMTSAFRLADKIAVLQQGEVLQIGTPEQIKNSAIPFVQQFIHGEIEEEG